MLLLWKQTPSRDVVCWSLTSYAVMLLSLKAADITPSRSGEIAFSFGGDSADDSSGLCSRVPKRQRTHHQRARLPRLMTMPSNHFHRQQGRAFPGGTEASHSGDGCVGTGPASDERNPFTQLSRLVPVGATRFASARDWNRDKNLAEYRSGELVLQSRPRYMLVELTQGCNLQCEMCRSQRIGISSSRLDSALFRRVAEELFPTAELVDLRGWGESLLLPNICEVMRYTRSFGCDVRFVTNLSFNRKAVLAALAEHHCYVAVSLDSAEVDVLLNLRRGASLARIRSNLKILVSQCRALHGNSDRIVLNCTVQAPALATLESLVTFAAEVGVPEVRLASVSASKKPHLSLCGRDEDVAAALQLVQRTGEQHGIRVVAATHFAGLPESDPHKMACLRPWSFACVNVDGLVGFCDHLIGPFARKYLIGDLRVSGFTEIWNSDQWQELRREHRGPRRAGAEMFSHCDWCYRKRFVEFEDLFLPELGPAKINLSTT